MPFFALTDDLIISLLSNWLTLLDFAAFETALCNHNQRAAFYKYFATKGVNFYRTFAFYSCSDEEISMDLCYEKFPVIDTGTAPFIMQWLRNRATQPFSLLVEKSSLGSEEGFCFQNSEQL
jgi:hypothetical protein